MKLFLRDLNKKADFYRKDKKIPGIVYGSEINPIAVFVDKNEFEKFYQNYESGLFDFDLDGEKYKGLIQDVQYHPITDEIIHFDIFVPSLKEKIETRVPLKFVGEAPVLRLGGVLSINLEELEIECLPEDIPHEIIIDLSVLKEVGQSIYVKDLNIPPKIKVLINPNNPVVTAIKEAEIVEEKETPTTNA